MAASSRQDERLTQSRAYRVICSPHAIKVQEIPSTSAKATPKKQKDTSLLVSGNPSQQASRINSAERSGKPSAVKVQDPVQR